MKREGEKEKEGEGEREGGRRREREPGDVTRLCDLKKMSANQTDLCVLKSGPRDARVDLDWDGLPSLEKQQH